MAISSTTAEDSRARPLPLRRLLSPWVDVTRKFITPEQKIYTWWSYRSPDWTKNDRGRRLDHIWSTAGLAPGCKKIEILKEARGWEQPSDHVPVMASFTAA